MTPHAAPSPRPRPRRVGPGLALALLAGALAPVAAPAPAGADEVHVHVHAPEVRFVSPPDVVYVGPGLWVVIDLPYEVFVADGWYWVWYEGVWWRHRHPGEPWVQIHVRHVPPRLTSAPRGRYRHYHPAGDQLVYRSDRVRGRHDGRGASPPPRGEGRRYGQEDDDDRSRRDRGDRGERRRGDGDRDRRGRGKGRGGRGR